MLMAIFADLIPDEPSWVGKEEEKALVSSLVEGSGAKCFLGMIQTSVCCEPLQLEDCV